MISLSKLKDTELLSRTKDLARREREITIEIVQHLREVERRKLYADLKYGSLFDYAVKELRYSASAAYRRIQMMRLVKEIPEAEAKVQSGALNLSSVCQAQNFFREVKRTEPQRVISVSEKKAILEKLENKSAREAEKVLLEMSPRSALPKDHVRQVTPEHVELRLVVDSKLEGKLKEIRALLGQRGASMTLGDLMAEMAALSLERLEEKKFGRRRIQAERAETQAKVALHGHRSANSTSDVGSNFHASRYISNATKRTVWLAAGGRCGRCGSQHRLQYDHIQPYALGGSAGANNIQLLCRGCNLRRGVKTYGVQRMRPGH